MDVATFLVLQIATIKRTKQRTVPQCKKFTTKLRKVIGDPLPTNAIPIDRKSAVGIRHQAAIELRIHCNDCGQCELGRKAEPKAA